MARIRDTEYLYETDPDSHAGHDEACFIRASQQEPTTDAEHHSGSDGSPRSQRCSVYGTPSCE
jgi:hypothetical protein